MDNMDSVDGFSSFLWTKWTLWTLRYAMDISTLDCGSRCCGFNPRQPPLQAGFILEITLLLLYMGILFKNGTFRVHFVCNLGGD